MDLSGSYAKRPHRGVEHQEAACRSDRGIRCPTLRVVHAPPHVPDPLGETHGDPFTLHILAGHTDMNTTKRYIHPNETHIREAMSKVWGGHSHEKGDPKAPLVCL